MKLTIFGRSRTGKTQLLNRLTGKEFNETEYLPTVEDLFNFEMKFDNYFVKMKLLDTQGLERFNQLRKDFIEFGDCFIVVYNLLDANSLKELQDLLKQIRSIKPAQQSSIMLLGTHSDVLDDKMQEQQQLKKNTTDKSFRKPLNAVDLEVQSMLATKQKAHNLAKQFKIKHFLVSSKTNFNLQSSFLYLVKQQRELTPKLYEDLNMDPIKRFLEIEEVHKKASLKKSLLRLSKSVSNLRESKSLRSMRSFWGPRTSESVGAVV